MGCFGFVILLERDEADEKPTQTKTNLTPAFSPRETFYADAFKNHPNPRDAMDWQTSNKHSVWGPRNAGDYLRVEFACTGAWYNRHAMEYAYNEKPTFHYDPSKRVCYTHGSSFDRGHLRASFVSSWRAETRHATYAMTNIAPKHTSSTGSGGVCWRGG